MKKTIAATLLLISISSSQAAVRYGNFVYYKLVDEITDDDNSLITGESEDKSSRLNWECEYNGLNITFNPEDAYFSKEDDNSVIVRFDKSTPFTIDDWSVSTSKDALFIPMEYVSVFTEYALIANSVTLRVTDTSGEIYTKTFSLNGLEKSLNLLSCYE